MFGIYEERRKQNQDIMVSAVIEMIDEQMRGIFEAAAPEIGNASRHRSDEVHNICATSRSTFEVFAILNAATEIYRYLRFSDETAADLAHTTLRKSLAKHISRKDADATIDAAFNMCEMFNPVARKAQYKSVSAGKDIATAALSDTDLENRNVLRDLLRETAVRSRPAPRWDAFYAMTPAT
ncbi:MAG: hypothetical protein AAF678_07925 [Pseudomonadota bacterium]